MYKSVNSSRGLWSRILLQQIMETCLAPGSLVLSGMSVEDIRRYATRPFRMEHRLESRPGPPLNKVDLRLYKGRSLTFSFDVGDGFRQILSPMVRLTPGGRWVIGVANANTQLRLFCWDLLPSRKDPQAPLGPIGSLLKPVAMIAACQPVHEHMYRSFEIQYDKLDQSVNVLLSYTSASM